jgi:hypothetical protein
VRVSTRAGARPVHTGWTVTTHGHTSTWTSPTGRTYRIHPYDYRTGP